MITELVVSLITVILFVLIYYSIRGIPPGAKMITQDIPAFSDKVDTNHANLMFFWTSWCPHCKHAQQPWKSLQQVIKTGKYTYGGKNILYDSVNAEADIGKADMYNIKAYPTIKLQTNDKVYEMVGPVTTSNLREFLKKALGSEKSLNS